jgi:PAS domain S-box-containing protein
LFLDLANPAITFALVNLFGIAIVLVVIARRSIFAGKTFFMIAIVSTLWWLFVTIMELSSVGLENKVFWSKLAYISVCSVPLSWMFFLYDYSFGRAPAKNSKRYGLIGAIMVAIMVGSLTNSQHLLFYGQDTRLITDQAVPFVIYDHGPMILVFASVIYLALSGSVAVTTYAAIFSAQLYRPIFRVLLLVALIPVVGNIGYLLFDFTIFNFDPTPFLFTFSLGLVTWLIFVTRTLELDSIATEASFLNTSDAILAYDRQGRIAGSNTAAQVQFKDSLPAKGQKIPNGGPIWSYAHKHLNATASPAPGSIQLGDRHFDIRLVPLERPLHRGNPIMGWILYLRDTTDLLALTTDLQAESLRLQTIMEHNAAGICVIDKNSRVSYANPVFARVFGCDIQDILNTNFSESIWKLRVRTPDLTQGMRPSTYVKKYGHIVEGVKIEITRSDGQIRILTVTAAPLDDHGRVVISAYDITGQELASKALREAAQRAEAANNAKSQFLANMSHEIRTPLNGVLGMAEILSFSTLTSEQKRIVTTIQTSGELLLGIFNNVLDMAKMEAGQLSLRLDPMRPLDIAGRVNALFAEQAKANNLVFEVRAQGDGNEFRMADELKLIQILQNLVSNAIKFTSTGHVLVRIILEPDGGPLELTVQDSGIGMNDADLGRVFEAFQQADPSITRQYGGVGLGLSIVKSMVDLMGGEIEVMSHPGEGTTFLVQIPLSVVSSS